MIRDIARKKKTPVLKLKNTRSAVKRWEFGLAFNKGKSVCRKIKRVYNFWKICFRARNESTHEVLNKFGMSETSCWIELFSKFVKFHLIKNGNRQEITRNNKVVQGGKLSLIKRTKTRHKESTARMRRRLKRNLSLETWFVDAKLSRFTFPPTQHHGFLRQTRAKTRAKTRANHAQRHLVQTSAKNFQIQMFAP